MYKTRFVFEIPLADVGNIATRINAVADTAGPMPISVFVQADNDTLKALATIVYMTSTSRESDDVIAVWRRARPEIQVERQHIMNPQAFEEIAMSGSNGRALRADLVREVRALCARGVGTAGILDYLTECESVVLELKEFVQSIREAV